MRLRLSAPLFPGVQGQMHRATLLLQRTHFFQSARLRKGNADSLRASASRRERARVCVAIFILKVPLAERERNTINTFVRWLLVIQPLCNRIWMEFLRRSQACLKSTAPFKYSERCHFFNA
jgi:hypothetical protein